MSEYSICLATYGWNGNQGQVAWLNCFDALVAELKISPAVAWYKLPGQTKSRRVEIRELRKLVISQPVETCEVMMPTTDENVEDSFYAGGSFGADRWLVFSHRDRISEFSVKRIIRSIQLLSTTIQLVYGYAFTREVSKSATMYALGTVCGLGFSPLELKEAAAISAWHWERDPSLGREPYWRCRSGMLRDVYPVNILSRSHLQSRVNDISLSEWISISDRRGQIDEVSNETSIWTVEPKEIIPIRECLAFFGAIITSDDTTVRHS